MALKVKWRASWKGKIEGACESQIEGVCEGKLESAFEGIKLKGAFKVKWRD